MSFTSLIFLFIFLPLALAIYYISNDRVKEYVLLAISLLFYSMGCVEHIVLFVISIAVTVCLGRIMSTLENRVGRKILLIAGILFNAGFLFYYKYFDFALSVFGKTPVNDAPVEEILLPLGISFYTFKAISYLADVYSGKAQLEDNPVHDLLYLSFFTQIQSGPITRYNDSKISNGRLSDSFANGAVRFMTGFCKKTIIANLLANISSEVFGSSLDTYSTSYMWLGSICFSLQLFFDFAGYTDMAVGISEMFGYKCMENFNYPYMTASVSEFWRRWHISLGEWFRDYVYIPLGGSRNEKKWRTYFNLFVVWLLTGIWHGAAWNFVYWGMGYFVLIAFERITGLPGRLKTVFGKTVYRIFVLLFINFQWVMFNSEDIKHGLCFIKRMLIFGHDDLAGKRVCFLLKDNAFFLVLAVIFCFPVVPAIRKKLSDNTVALRIFEIVEYIVLVAAFIWGISFVVAGQNNPFVYANF